jgi:hypothetical protein
MKLLAAALLSTIFASNASAQMGPTVNADDRSLACFSLSLYPVQVVYWADCALRNGKSECGWARPSQYGNSALQALKTCVTGRPYKTIDQILEDKQRNYDSNEENN